MIVVPSLLPRSDPEARRMLRTLSGHRTPVELRVDALEAIDPVRLLSGPRPPVILTCRRSAEGGSFDGTDREVGRILLVALSAGAEFIDVEYALGSRLRSALVAAAGRRRTVLSFHDPSGTPPGLLHRFRSMASLRPAYVKIAVRAEELADTGPVLELLAEARRLRQPSAVIAMGEYGAYTRILQGALGGRISYAAFDRAAPTAPGQFTFNEMTRLYRAGSIDRRTKIFGLLGNPVSRSRGIIHHNEVFRRKKRNAVYVNFLADDAVEFLSLLGDRITGLSVTMPFKKAIGARLDILEASSVLTGSVNTVARRRGALVGSNTDFHAFLSLLRRAVDPSGKRLIVIGTGGTAATVAGAAAVSGARVVIAGRRAGPARALADRFGAGWMRFGDLADAGGDILVNATPVGMAAPAGAGRGRERIVPASLLRRFRVVCDFANPPGGSTALVADARSRGIRAISGREIFEAQAALQSEVFLGLC